VGADAGPLSVGASRHPATRTARMLRAVCSQESRITTPTFFWTRRCVDGVPRLPPLALGAQAASWIEMCEAVQKFRRGGVAVI
jgi:hypothetical protein